MTTKKFQIRMSTELLQALKTQAEKENRTMSNLVKTIIKNYLEREERK